MRQFYFDSTDGDDYDYDENEMEMGVEQYIVVPEIVIQQDNLLTVQMELKKTLLSAAISISEKTWGWKWKSIKKKQEMIKSTYLALEKLVRLEYELEVE
jgi:hypothetical protein